MKTETWNPGSCCIGNDHAVTYTSAGCEEVADGPDRLCSGCRAEKPKAPHTPGPWQIRHNGDPSTPASIVRDYGTHSVNVVDSCDPCDAALIAAAPDLAAALAALVAECSAARTPTVTQWNAAQDALRKAGIL